MFIRVKTVPGRTRKAVQLVASIRTGNQVRQTIIRHIGTAEDEAELERMTALGEFIKAQLQADVQPQLFPPEPVAEPVIAGRRQRDDRPLPVNLKDLRETARIITGIHDVYGQLYAELGLDELLTAQRYRASNRALFQCVMARLAHPRSKRGSVSDLASHFGIRLPLQRVYRLMDHLDERFVRRLHRVASTRAQALFGDTLRVLLFDCTTLYFESFTADELKPPGDSKDGKFKECQVLLALVVTDAGLPIHHLVLPGATFEGHSLVPVVEALKTEHHIREAIVVADRGMMNAANLQSLRAAGLSYIVGAKLRQLPVGLRAQVLDRNGGQPCGDQGGRVKTLSHPDGVHRLVVSDSPARAHRDRQERERAVTQRLKKLNQSNNPKDLLNTRGPGRFIQLDGTATLSVNEDKVAREAQWDGLHGVLTNLPDTTAASTVLQHYRGLWQVEETFRVSKSDLKVRPIFHWTPRRVRAHLAIAFMTLLCVRHLQYRSALRFGDRHSPEVMATALTQVQHSVLEDRHTGRRYALPSHLNEVSRRLYRVMGLTVNLEPFELK